MAGLLLLGGAASAALLPTGSTLEFSSASYSATENGGQATITVKRSGSAVWPVSVSYASANGSASAGSDYTAATGTLSWKSGDKADKTFVVVLLDDQVVGIRGDRDAETLRAQDREAGRDQFRHAEHCRQRRRQYPLLRLGQLHRGRGQFSGGHGEAHGLGCCGQREIRHRQWLRHRRGRHVAASATLNWAAGDSTPRSFSVALADDTSQEPDESFTISLSNATGATLAAPSTITVTIPANDAPPPSGSDESDPVRHAGAGGWLPAGDGGLRRARGHMSRRRAAAT